MSIKISFLAHGHFNQTIDIVEDGLTAAKLVAGLNSGKYMTTVHGDTDPENCYIQETATGKKVARIKYTDNALSYADYEVVDD